MYDEKLGYDPIETTVWDPSDGITSEADAAAYLTLMLNVQEDWAFLDAIGAVARAYSMGKIAEKAGVSRESLYRSLSAEGNPRFTTVMRVLDALGYTIEVKPKKIGAHAKAPDADDNQQHA